MNNFDMPSTMKKDDICNLLQKVLSDVPMDIIRYIIIPMAFDIQDLVKNGWLDILENRLISKTTTQTDIDNAFGTAVVCNSASIVKYMITNYNIDIRLLCYAYDYAIVHDNYYMEEYVLTALRATERFEAEDSLSLCQSEWPTYTSFV